MLLRLLSFPPMKSQHPLTRHNSPAETRHTWLEKSAVAIAVLAFLAAAGQGWIARDTEQRGLRAYVFLPPDNEVDVVVWPSTTSASEIQVNVKNIRAEHLRLITR